MVYVSTVEKQGNAQTRWVSARGQRSTLTFALICATVLLQAQVALSKKPYPKHLEHISYWRNKLFDPDESDTFKLIYPGIARAYYRVSV